MGKRPELPNPLLTAAVAARRATGWARATSGGGEARGGRCRGTDGKREVAGRSGSPNGGKGCEKPARQELTRFEGAKLRAKQRLRGLKRLWQNGGGWTA
eukprot:SM001558S02110  [mRNA]  locus=s1558:768:1327:- [translate_table: standard]